VNQHTLLVVDSDPAVHQHLCSLLGREDLVIQNAYDGGEALKRLRQTPFEVVVAGQGRNGLGGVKLLRRIRTLRPDARVIVTGEPETPSVLTAIRYRAFSYFHKPLPDSTFSDMVQQALDSKSWKDDIRLISARPEWITIEVRCKLEAAERTTHFLREIGCALPGQAREDVCVAFRELLLNAVEHGGGSDPKKRVRVSLLETSRAVIVHIHDPGRGFSLDFLPHAAISNPENSPTRHVEVRAEEGRRPGGFGILVTRNMVDDLLYNERGNAVLFIKYL
jgi:two-component system, OmpR family, response regulator